MVVVIVMIQNQVNHSSDINHTFVPISQRNAHRP